MKKLINSPIPGATHTTLSPKTRSRLGKNETQADLTSALTPFPLSTSLPPPRREKSENIAKMSLSKSDLNGLFQFSKITLDKSKAAVTSNAGKVSSETLSETEVNVINETLATSQGAAVSDNRQGPAVSEDKLCSLESGN